MKRIIFVLVPLLILSACNGGGGGSGSTTSGGSSGGGGGTSDSSAPTGALSDFYDLNVFVNSHSPNSSSSLNTGAPNSHTGSNTINSYDGSGDVSINRWNESGASFQYSQNLQDYIDENVDPNIFVALLFPCFIQALNPNDNSFFTETTGAEVRTLSISSSATAAAPCVGGAGNLDDMFGSGLTLTFKVALTSNTTNYDFKITFTSLTSEKEGTGPLNWVMYFRNSTTHLNALMILDDSYETYRESGITGISYIKSTQVTVLEHAFKIINDTSSSDGFGDTDFGRMIIDPESDDIRIMSHEKYETGARASLSFATSATNLDYLSLSASWANLSGVYSDGVTNAGACIQVSDYSLLVDGNSTCSGKTALPASGMNAVTDSLYSIAPSTINSRMDGSYYEDKLPSFTAATILSAPHGL